ncbi:hypothetical protein BDQ94DRAFT_164339 [Aspergillus welwitschiae]|uniref:Uncharacterized protein n=1 Tax=Aspergillus welwitschiae TaxID=1341132 RepID=A0A3F3PI20_9EURO|nr:hypothetical protein BDQ94DRAFT_164339 [Aspergillus welwitschiae]RDH26604.1 hypothetical protein BDQ94DRAFT_164339 [Aspergillus welwitschiae]
MKQQICSADIALEFDRLRNDYILEADENALKFLEKARTSLESPQTLKRRDTSENPSFIMLPWENNDTPLSYLVYAGNPKMGNLKATEAFLRERGAKLNGSKNAFKRAWVWILTYSRLLSCVRPNA